MFENLRERLCERVCECINLHQEDHPEDTVFGFWESKLGYYIYVSGSFIRVDPDHILLFLAYNSYILLTIMITYCLSAYTLLCYPGDFSRAVTLIHLCVLMTIGGITHIHMLFHREDGHEFIETVLRLDRTRKLRRSEDSSTRENIRLFFTKAFPPIVWLCWFIYICGQPLYQYYINSKSFVLPFELWLPFDTHNMFGFILAICFQLLAVNCFCSQAITNIPAFLYVCNMVIDEYSMLIDSIRTLHDDTLSEFQNTEEGRDYKSTISSFDLYRDPKFLVCLRRRFKQIIHHHHTIISMFEALQMVSGVPLTAILGVGGTAVGLGIGVVISGYGDLSLKIIFTVVVIINLFIAAIICYLGQRLNDLGETLREELYFTNWYDWPEDMKRSLRIMLARTLQPLALTSAFITIKPNNDTFATIINTAYSFINVLIAFQE